MTNKERKAFIEMPADGNIMRLAQQLLSGPAQQRWQIIYAVRLLYKLPGSKDLSVKEVVEAINMISEKGIAD